MSKANSYERQRDDTKTQFLT